MKNIQNLLKSAENDLSATWTVQEILEINHGFLQRFDAATTRGLLFLEAYFLGALNDCDDLSHDCLASMESSC